MWPVLFAACLFLTASCHQKGAGSDVLLLSCPAGVNEVSGDWQREYWSKPEYHRFEPSDRSPLTAMVLDADSMTRARWYRNLPVRPYSKYRLSGWVRTENVTAAGNGEGAGFRGGRIDLPESRGFTGTNDWTYVVVEFDTGGEDSFMLECVLGLGSRAKGRAWFDEIRLERLHSEVLAPELAIHLDRPGEPLSERMFGQFIEHMGRCIYGGIWAEMIEDRKFFLQPGSEGSPWHLEGPASLQMSRAAPYVGEHDPVIRAAGPGGALVQGGLGLIEGMAYEGRIILSAPPEALPVEVELAWGENAAEKASIVISELEAGFQTVPLAFTAGASTHEGEIRILAGEQGGVTIGTLSLMPTSHVEGFRADVLELLFQLDAPVYRWPGGNFVSGYDWKDGVGPRDRRPPRYEAAWNGIESNDVGIDEFMRLCALLGTEANIAVNTGLGTPAEAAQQVEYVNGGPETPMGGWRARNGRQEPYGVMLWAVGNEMFGDWQLGVMPVEEYVHKHNETARLMWEADPSISLIAVGYPGRWNDMMYAHSADYMTHISEHFYRQDWHAGGLMTHVKQIPDAIRAIAEEHRRCRREHPGLKERDIRIALDEWNYWYGPHVYGLLGTRYFLQDALGIAAGFNEFLRQTDIFFMANYAQTVNVIGAIKATKTASFMEGTGEVLRLYRRELQPIPLETSGSAAPLDVAASLSEDGRILTVSVINATEQSQRLALSAGGGELPGRGRLYYITGPDRHAYNEVDNPLIREHAEAFRLRRGKVSVPPMSACIYKFNLQ
jgi:alpha-N-arabinofuranosidase